jgi:hypothetical protein
VYRSLDGFPLLQARVIPKTAHHLALCLLGVFYCALNVHAYELGGGLTASEWGDGSSV